MFSNTLLEKLKQAQSVVFFTGAGVSAESGIETFRGKGGLWTKLKPEELANFDAFLKNPDLVWEWYQYRRRIIDETKPNNAHIIMAEMEKHFKKVAVATQNIDNLHRRAGSKTVYELHGNIERNYCVKCNTFYTSDNFNYEGKVPKCKCGGLIRPDIVWFGEMLPQDVFSSATRDANNCDVIFVVGTSAVVYPAAYIPIDAKRYGAYVVEINLERTDLTPIADESYFGKAGEIMPVLLEEYKKFIHTGN
jgi:NAD-dependent deacetylase